MSRVELPDTYLEAEVVGEGETVVLSPGLAGLGSFWSKQVPALSANYKVVTYDHRGCGRSKRDIVAVSVESMAADLLALLDALGIERAALVGHSTGGAIGQYLAAHHPDRLTGLVLSCSWPASNIYFVRLLDFRKRVLEVMGVGDYGLIGSFFLYPPRYLAEHPELLGPKVIDHAELFMETSRRRIEAILEFDSRPYLGSVRMPTLIIGAVDDMLTPQFFAQELARSITGAEITLLPYGGHSCPVTATDEYNAVLLRFLGRLAR